VREKAWQAQVIELALLYGWFVYHTYDSQPGWPDLVLARPTTGELIFVELKTDVGRLSPAQRSWLRVLEDCNQEVHVWRPRDFEAVHARLKRPHAGAGSGSSSSSGSSSE
jgi:hypothetical protein